MKQKHMTIAAVASGIVCAICVSLFLASVQGEANAARNEALARYGGEQVEVCVATRDIAAGERVDPSALETRMWVADLLPEGALSSNADALGKVATSSILKGEVVSAKRFEGARDQLDVPSGKAAVSVPAKAVQAVGGAIRPGMSVDVYSSGDTSTAALARGVVVLDTSVGSSSSLSSGDAGWMTLAVDPEHVEELIAAAARTTLYFVLPGEAVSQPAADAGQQAQASQPEPSRSAAAPSPESAEPDAQEAPTEEGDEQ